MFSLYIFIVRLHLQISWKIFTLLTHIYIFLLFYFTIHLIMTEARSKRRVLPLVFIVKTFTFLLNFNVSSFYSCAVL